MGYGLRIASESTPLSERKVTAFYILKQPDEQDHPDNDVGDHFDDLGNTGYLGDAPQDQTNDAQHNKAGE